MKMYAIVLYFDSLTEETLTRLRDKVGEITGNDYMIKNNIPPHVTVGAFCAEPEQEAELIRATEELSCGISRTDIAFVSLASFGHGTVFCSPIPTRALMGINAQVNKRFSDFTPGNNGRYLTDGWMPHLALGCRLDKAQYMKAIEMLTDEFYPLCGKADRIAVAQCEPYTELTVFDLTGK